VPCIYTTLQGETLEVVAPPTGSASGRAKCPYDPKSIYVFTYVSKCTSFTY